MTPHKSTRKQCIEYKLPRTPLKETERRAARFQERFGEGATELDALEALHPGELRRIIETEIARYHDCDIDRAVEATAASKPDIPDFLRRTPIAAISEIGRAAA